jgi:hypothetical protein
MAICEKEKIMSSIRDCLNFLFDWVLTLLPACLLGCLGGALLACVGHILTIVHVLVLGIGLSVVGSMLAILAGLWVSRDGKDYLGRTEWVVALYLAALVSSAYLLT